MPEPSAPDPLDVVRRLVAEHRDTPGALLPLLHAVQDTLGHVGDDTVPIIAAGLNLSRAEVHGVITYYHHFRREPAGRVVVQVCSAEACLACGSDALLAHAQRALGCEPRHTREDGAYTLEPVYCLGLCASSPAMQVNGTLHARVTHDRFDRVIAAMEAAA